MDKNTHRWPIHRSMAGHLAFPCPFQYGGVTTWKKRQTPFLWFGNDREREEMRFAHTNIAAKNWKQLSDFYIKVFGCRVKPPERKLSGPWLDQATGLHNAVLEGVHLALPGYGEGGPTLEIFSYQETHLCEPMMANHTGFTHIAFEVADVDQTLKNALDHGGRLLGSVTEKTVAGVGDLKFVYFRDPEGNIVEIQSWKKQGDREKTI